ncbi:Eaa1 [Klebsiella pneumoniae]|uniref:Eaa1 n=1 Tax=Klebsiella pneumoniae TaxID=573 RepID=A0A377Y6G3_KLEPN|nr:Eaa1 [Klebsiella pneumoniae]
MTSKLTRERIELIANFHRAMTLPPSHAEIEELARMALAAMDSEPHTDDELSNLLWYSQEATCHSDPNYYCEFQRLATPGLIAGIIRELQERRKAAMDSEPVAYISKSDFDAGYPHILARRDFNKACTMPVYAAQPTPAVPKSISVREAISALESEDAVTTIGQAYKMGWNACRAAMLERQLVDRVDEKSLTSINPAPDLVSLQKKAEPIIGNSPVIPDGYVMAPKVPTDEMISSGIAAHYERSQIQIHDRPAPGPMECAYVAMLAAAPQSPGSELATVPGKWIPVSERIPEDEQEVLTINKIGHRFVSFFDKHSGLFFDRLDAPAACCIEHVLVTHWMPLPNPPKE